MDKIELIRLLDVLINFFDNYNLFLDDLDKSINEAEANKE